MANFKSIKQSRKINFYLLLILSTLFATLNVCLYIKAYIATTETLSTDHIHFIIGYRGVWSLIVLIFIPVFASWAISIIYFYILWILKKEYVVKFSYTLVWIIFLSILLSGRDNFYRDKESIRAAIYLELKRSYIQKEAYLNNRQLLKQGYVNALISYKPILDACIDSYYPSYVKIKKCNIKYINNMQRCIGQNTEMNYMYSCAIETSMKIIQEEFSNN